MYHLGFPAKYRRSVIFADVDEVLKEICLEIGTDVNHVHFLVHRIPTYSVTKIVRMLRSLTALEVLRRHLQVKNKGEGSFGWTDILRVWWENM